MLKTKLAAIPNFPRRFGKKQTLTTLFKVSRVQNTLALLVTLGAFMVHGQDSMISKPKMAQFNSAEDLLLLHYDCKTDVDDLHAIAAFASLVTLPGYKDMKYHVVAGTYGIQEGAYVPPNAILEMAYKPVQWSDAHANFEKAVDVAAKLSLDVLGTGGDIWIAEAGQSDFSAALVQYIKTNSNTDTQKSVHVVQHSKWNEKKTDPKHLDYVKSNCDYIKIPDGNTPGNGSAGYKTSEEVPWKDYLVKKETIKIWEMAVELAHFYNGRDGRYLNPAIQTGGMDFSDFSEVQVILRMQKQENCLDYFKFIQAMD